MRAKPLFPMLVVMLFLAVLAIAGCASVAHRADAIAGAAGFTKEIAKGAGFRHLVYAATGPSSAPVWIYIEGDGIPWLTEYVPAADPTPRTLVALEAMTVGPRPALFIGRPCYFEVNNDPRCEPVLWTHRRFAPEIVASMAAAVDAQLDARRLRGRPVVLVGFSGGGTLATLIAHRLARICALVTLASPLDIGEWVQERGYSEMTGSMDPARLPALSTRVRQVHLRGRHDPVVAAANGARYLSKNPEAELRVFEQPGHGSEWIQIWRDLVHTRGALPVDRCEVERP